MQKEMGDKRASRFAGSEDVAPELFGLGRGRLTRNRYEHATRGLSPRDYFGIASVVDGQIELDVWRLEECSKFTCGSPMVVA
jgi:hypothetical protein